MRMNHGATTITKKEELVFCFIYKYRTRFALVAGEILSRLIYEDHCTRQNFHGDDDDDNHKEDKDLGTGDPPKRSVIIDRIGHARMERLERMLDYYREREMLVTDLRTAAASSCVSGVPC
mmetsp:Transcript_55258/g.82179  ORF Transcript_55258/g.82179 Transcript_55258/m.82179 type:complete len:120 (+) Transcript_55258:671-1030(+)